MLRCRPALRSAAAIRAWVKARPAAGVGAIASTATASPAGQVLTERGHRRGVVLPQHRPQLVVCRCRVQIIV
jgi:hypothetical protein